MDIKLSNILNSAKDYLLASNDERMLFDWLVLKQHDFGLSKPFRHSIQQIEEATLVKRKMQNSILKKFTDLGFLTIGKDY